jgi:hypothetical protein
MIAKPNRKGVVIGEVWTVRTGTDSRTIKQETEDPNDPGANVIRRFRVEVPVTGSLVWNGKDWVAENVFRQTALRNIQESGRLPKPKTVLRKGK